MLLNSTVSSCVETCCWEVEPQAMNNWSACTAVERDPLKVSGTWLFRGTRVPVAALFENLEDGALVTDFVAWFPGVTLQQARAVLEYAAQTLEVA